MIAQAPALQIADCKDGTLGLVGARPSSLSLYAVVPCATLPESALPDVWYLITLAPRPRYPRLQALQQLVFCIRSCVFNALARHMPCRNAMRHTTGISSSPFHPLAVGLAGSLVFDEVAEMWMASTPMTIMQVPGRCRVWIQYHIRFSRPSSTSRRHCAHASMHRKSPCLRDSVAAPHGGARQPFR
jgi:hypothetical protein